MPYAIGDVVQLKSYGPIMTVVRVGDFPQQGLKPGILCAWFDGAKKYEDVFPPEALKHYHQDDD